MKTRINLFPKTCRARKQTLSVVKRLALWGVASLWFSVAVSLNAATPEFTLEIKNHLFYPAEIVVPANLKVRLRVINQDDTPEEFESYELNREKVIMGNSQTIIFIGPLAPGEYPFFGEFNVSTAQGKVIAK
ncbi:cupredoxin domain-containing protein [Aestuariicella hydrocarbonica]|uniref:Cupredoxin domain-containing protein n=1 Tax=Pseudomaricurvus hydrocarbonicus TaxID=1470433 RepID=A0A9E5JSY7_9GAMM|nr:cupredoxin domain-containing protein [Aestuariicella hydrocarbonica]NHO64993.1 cupredoxin domain-containing protein [Aestuariicella hydrocarbonica]